MTRRRGYCKHEWHSAGMATDANGRVIVVLYCRKCAEVKGSG